MNDGALGRRGLGRQIARNTLLGWIGRFVSVLGWTLLAPWILHRLGAERFGLWSLLATFSGLAIAFDLGLQGALTKFVAEHRAADESPRARVMLGMGLSLYLMLGLVTITAVVLLRAPIMDFFHLSAAMRTEAGTALVVAALATLTLNLSLYGGALLSGLHRLDLWSQLGMYATLVQIGLSALVIRMGGGVTGLLTTSAAVNLAVALVAAVTAFRMAPDLLPTWANWTRAQAKRMGNFSLALQVISAGLLLQFQLDKVLFGRWVGLGAVAEYELAYRVIFGVWTVPALLLPPLLPAVAHLHASGRHDAVIELFRRGSRYVLAVALPLAAGMVAFSPAVLGAWLGPGHHDAALAATVLGAVLGVNILTGVGSAVVRGVGRPGLEAEYFVLATAVHVPLSLVLIPRLGFAGGMWALGTAGVVGSLWFVVRVHRALGLSLVHELRTLVLPPLVVALATGALGGWIAHAVAGTSVGRIRLLEAVGAGGVVLVGLAALALFGTGYVKLGEVRSLLAGRATPAEVAP